MEKIMERESYINDLYLSKLKMLIFDDLDGAKG